VDVHVVLGFIGGNKGGKMAYEDALYKNIEVTITGGSKITMPVTGFYYGTALGDVYTPAVKFSGLYC